MFVTVKNKIRRAAWALMLVKSDNLINLEIFICFELLDELD